VLAVALALAAGAQAAAGAPALVERYADLGWRLDERPSMPSVPSAHPQPVLAPDRAAAAAYPLRGPTTVRVEPGGAILVDEAMARRVVRLGTAGRVAVVPGREPPRLPACRPQAADGVRIWADPAANQVFRATGPGTRTAIAGTGRTGFTGDGGPAIAARLDQPTCAVRAADGAILVADRGNGRVRRIAPDGTIETIAGSGGTMSPQSLLTMPDGATLISDPGGARVLRLAPDGVVTTVAGTGEPGWDGDGGPATRARLTMPWGLALQATGGVVVSDFGSQTVRRISPAGTITTILGAPPQRTAVASRALRATVPARRRVAWWLNPGDAGTSEEAASGRRAVIRSSDLAGPVDGVRVVRGGTTFTWWRGDEFGCWGVAPTAHGIAGDGRQARDVQAATRSREPYAPGSGPYAPDLARGRLVLARALVTADGRPELGVPAWASAWGAQRLVGWVIDRRSGRVVAMQVWAWFGLAARYRIAPSRGPLTTPVTRPRGRGPQCQRGSGAGFAYGFRDGIALARRVGRRLEGVPALHVRMEGRRSAGARVTASSAIALDEGRVRQELLHVVTPGPSRMEAGMAFGSRTALTTTAGVTFTRLRGEACWRAPDGEVPRDPSSATERVMSWEDAFFERPRRRGRLLVLRAYTVELRVDSLIDPRDMRLVEQRWVAFASRGRLSLREAPSVPAPPAPRPRCPAGRAG
jgi:hypothetical protein